MMGDILHFCRKFGSISNSECKLVHFGTQCIYEDHGVRQLPIYVNYFSSLVIRSGVSIAIYVDISIWELMTECLLAH